MIFCWISSKRLQNYKHKNVIDPICTNNRHMGLFLFLKRGIHILTGKTHFTFGTAVTILMTHPTDWKSFLLCLGAGAVGACVSDVDVSTSGSHKGFQRLLLLLAAAVLVVAGLDFFFQAGIWTMIQQRNGLLRSLAGFAIFLALCLYGEHQPHRSFTHSLAGVAMLGTAVFIMLPQAVWYFVCGMEHIFCWICSIEKRCSYCFRLTQERFVFGFVLRTVLSIKCCSG